ncbi:tRNA (guanine-N(7)-)-methyltransferase [Desulfitobacterium dichloroeliminans LMG P-21439]|uniref:tRNA (guanine-N(7)-)-methyltransferase n=1 Tax=Desulfitobacterium dichloroeliminans (strain LMG P-21439 / DCA1) TaxID=871963 RepID=L0F9M0_DESDL|nr:tRNA (guanosine(46)-N7)-methyltransferase TrmB [Desulfitobacterium dichloroeliminans]AGA69638.1 tRNA (guanine-N(7)-)-methyltransferase [Desulfitobacterium dichloroeliminans LMG P-21439]
MRLRRKAWARPELENDDLVIINPSDYKGKWQEIFKNDQPIYLELGCGRGQFISQCAELNSQFNYIAIDLYDEVLVKALRKINEKKLINVRIIPMNIAKLEEIFSAEEIDKIYINFCNPWPSRRHHHKRLTYPNFLRVYKKILKKRSEIWFKTDDDDLFKDSLRYFGSVGFQEKLVHFDLHQSDFQENVMTEYEEKFSGQGIKIKFGIFEVDK